ncbi:MAG: hypothetical protein FJ225_08075 [Lentisphaerae bacterium]|nr:hypothetical protein [Lentisphaerota bacterium]
MAVPAPAAPGPRRPRVPVGGNPCRRARVAALLLAASVAVSRAASVEGEGWAVHYNVPDQDTSFALF